MSSQCNQHSDQETGHKSFSDSPSLQPPRGGGAWCRLLVLWAGYVCKWNAVFDVCPLAQHHSCNVHLCHVCGSSVSCPYGECFHLINPLGFFHTPLLCLSASLLGAHLGVGFLGPRWPRAIVSRRHQATFQSECTSTPLQRRCQSRRCTFWLTCNIPSLL